LEGHVHERWVNEALGIMQGFVSLERLELQYFCWGILGNAALVTLRTFPVLKCLHLWHCEFTSFDQVVDIVYSHSTTLHTLELCSELGPPRSIPTRLPPPPNLRVLLLEHREKGNIVDWLVFHGACPKIQFLAVEIWANEDFVHMTKLLKHLGPSLLLLRIEFYTAPSKGVFSKL
jgi:hypothetical protein